MSGYGNDGSIVPSMDPLLQKKVEFYEADHALTKHDRQDLGSTLGRICTYSSAISWIAFMGSFSGAFYKKRYRAGPSLGIGFISMTISAPIVLYMGRSYIKDKYSDNSKCLTIINMFSPISYYPMSVYYSESAKNPDLALKDPRIALNANKQGQPLLQNRDPIGLFKKRPLNTELKEENEVTIAKNNGSINETSDPFNDVNQENTKQESRISSWDAIRRENGLARNGSSSSSWDRIRNQNNNINQSQESKSRDDSQSDSPFDSRPLDFNNNYNEVENDDKDEDFKRQQEEFDRTLEAERSLGDDNNEQDNWKYGSGSSRYN